MLDLTDAKIHLADDLRSILGENHSSPVWPDITSRQFAAHALYNSVFSKYNDEEEPSEDACQAALSLFIEANSKCSAWRPAAASSKDDCLLGHFRDELYKFFHGTETDGSEPWDPGWQTFFNRGGVGPGASIGAFSTDFYSKVFSSPLTATSDSLIYIWEKLASYDPTWRKALQEKAKSMQVSKLVASSKLGFVNKKVHIARTICTEPTINMWFQLGIGSCISERLKYKFNIDLSTQQDVNSRLARVGSLTNQLATIDLKSASDSISVGLILWAFRDLKWFLNYLMGTRSPSVICPNKARLDLDMISSMGNGFTFPLQTLIFTCVVKAAYAFEGIRFCTKGDYATRNAGVFGDDIICENAGVSSVLRLLTLLGFTVNAEKSFVNGRFRESCGTDWFNGNMVRPVYIKKARSDQDLFVAINRLIEWTAETLIPLPSFVGYLRSQIRGRAWQIPPDENPDGGIRIPLYYADKVVKMKHGIIQYKHSVPKGVGYTIHESGDITFPPFLAERLKPSLKSNPDGLYLSFLGGYIRGMKATLRQRSPVYTTKRRITSRWDFTPVPSLFPPVDWGRRWYSAVETNLSLYIGA